MGLDGEPVQERTFWDRLRDLETLTFLEEFGDVCNSLLVLCPGLESMISSEAVGLVKRYKGQDVHWRDVGTVVIDEDGSEHLMTAPNVNTSWLRSFKEDELPGIIADPHSLFKIKHMKPELVDEVLGAYDGFRNGHPMYFD